MGLLNYVKLPFSSGPIWHELQASWRSVVTTFLFLVLPFSLMPPAMLVYAGAHHPSVFMMAGGLDHWKLVAALFFGVEMVTVPFMAWLIRYRAAERQTLVSFDVAFMLAAISAVPLWLSSLGLGFPSLWLMIAIVVLGLVLAATTLYHGCHSVLKMSDPIEAQAFASEVFAAGALLWVLVCTFVVLQSTEL